MAWPLITSYSHSRWSSPFFLVNVSSVEITAGWSSEQEMKPRERCHIAYMRREHSSCILKVKSAVFPGRVAGEEQDCTWKRRRVCLSKFREPWGGGQGPAFRVNGLWPVNSDFSQPENDRLPLLHHLRWLENPCVCPPPFIHADLSTIVPLSCNKRGGRITSKSCDWNMWLNICKTMSCSVWLRISRNECSSGAESKPCIWGCT